MTPEMLHFNRIFQARTKIIVVYVFVCIIIYDMFNILCVFNTSSYNL